MHPGRPAARQTGMGVLSDLSRKVAAQALHEAVNALGLTRYKLEAGCRRDDGNSICGACRQTVHAGQARLSTTTALQSAAHLPQDMNSIVNLTSDFIDLKFQEVVMFRAFGKWVGGWRPNVLECQAKVFQTPSW